ncbi:MAG TPA: class I tRNA ligase family protein, partial [Clostridia bacterium]|nr:class I tRNA ligase family protein [Clostridia bacterium]
ALPESELPLVLPELLEFIPGDDGSSPLERAKDWVNTTCPKCGRKAKRETDTMPQWAGSSWYFLRYVDPHNNEALASKEALEYWTPVDWYNGGMEHTTLHLLYSRFWHKFLYDIGVVPTPEPYQKRTSHGMILGENGEKMSKSRGNVINPDDIVNELGADTFRLYEMFMGAFDQPIPWSETGARGCRRFLERVYRLLEMVKPSLEGETSDMRPKLHGCIKKVTEDYERMKFNTAIAAMMTLVNEFYQKGEVSSYELHMLLTLLSPVAPHIAEELNESLGYAALYKTPWPGYDEAALIEDSIEMAIQINGKLRGRMVIETSASREAIEEAALNNADIAKFLGAKTVKKIIVARNLVNIVAL